jgi:hypothetical protein
MSTVPKNKEDQTIREKKDGLKDYSIYKSVLGKIEEDNEYIKGD